eukprot:978756_1
MDSIVRFYAQVLDSLHFYLLHLFECGLRTEKGNPNDTDDNKQVDAAGNASKYFDKSFARVSKMINARQHIRLAFHRLKNNSKFNIQAAESVSSDILYMDEVFRYLLLSTKHIGETAIRKFWKFLSSQQYDTESLKGDITRGSVGNIALNIEDKDAFSAIVGFFKATELRSSSSNSNYWWMSKSLREMVELYGDNRYDLKGPFYCGLSVVLPFPEFAIRLCGPTSTSLPIETAINFAG